MRFTKRDEQHADGSVTVTLTRGLYEFRQYVQRRPGMSDATFARNLTAAREDLRTFAERQCTPCYGVRS